MTTGNKTVDSRQTQYVYNPYTPGTVALKIGSIRQRSWNGQDWANETKPLKPPPPPEHSPGLGILSRPPKRARREEHSYSCSGLAEWTPLCYADHKTTKNMYRVSNGWTSATLTHLSFPASLQTHLIGKLHTAIAGSDFNAGIFLGEGKESLRTISSNCMKIYNSLRLVKRGRFGEARRILTGYGNNRRIALYDDPNWIDSKHFLEREKWRRQYDRDISAAWLELSYGWIPMLSDVKAGAEFLAHHLNVPLQQRYVVRSGYKEKAPVYAGTDFVFRDSFRSVSRQIICYLRERDVATLSGITDPLQVAWELTPWSFVIDWFIPIGNYLSARGTASALKGDFITSTYQRAVAAGLTTRPANGSNFATNWVLRSGHQQRRVEKYAVTRDISTSIAVPLPSFTPLSRVPSWSRAANAVALLDQLRPRGG